ncbi:alpha/beta hydrolase [bacterium]|nr:alpha/beta hydrolase [bacterium]
MHITPLSLNSNRSLQARLRFEDSIKPTLLLLHGLGDSSQAWEKLFEDQRFDGWNLVAPDLAGFGGTGAIAGSDFSFAGQLKLVGDLLATLKPRDLVITGHSMSGVMGGWLVASLLNHLKRQDTSSLTAWTGVTAEDLLTDEALAGINLRGFVSVEGTIVLADASISHRAVTVADRGRYDRWYEAFVELSSSNDWLKENPGANHYKQSIRQALPEAFLACARDLDNWKKASDQPGLTHAAHLLRSIDLPRAYCYGSRSVHPEALKVLRESSTELIRFEGAGHWLMIEQSEWFREVLAEKLKQW